MSSVRGPVSYTHLDVYKRQIQDSVEFSGLWFVDLIGLVCYT